MRSDGGTEFLLDLPDALLLRDGDGLLLEDGSVIVVKAAIEALLCITATDSVTLARLAWHLGNRHVPAQITSESILIRNDHVLSAMVRGLGGDMAPVQAPFTPESGAYTGAGQQGGHQDHHAARGHETAGPGHD